MTYICSVSHTNVCSRCVHCKKDLHENVLKLKFCVSRKQYRMSKTLTDFKIFCISIQLKKKNSKNSVKTSLRWFSFSKQVQDRVSQKHQKPKQIVEIAGTNGLYNLLRLRKKQSRLFYSTWLIFWIGFKLVRGKKKI